MAYLKDPREDTIDLDKHAIWEADNRVEQRWQWNAMVIDYCDMTPEEYMKNPIVEAVKSSSQDTADAINDKANEVIDAINSASTSINDNIDESTQAIIDAIGSGGTPSASVTIYYASINSQIDYTTLTQQDFSNTSIVGTTAMINYLFGDPTEENWQKFLNHEIDEQTLRHLSSNSYYLLVPYSFKDKFIIQENGIADVTSNFIEVEQDIIDNYVLYQSVDDDYFNEDYPSAVNVKQPHKITLEK